MLRAERITDLDAVREELAVYNALLQATATTGVDDHRLEALPLDRLKEILARHSIGAPTK